MFNSIGIGELIIIMGIALVVIGPERFPTFTKIVLRTMRDLRDYVNDIKRDIQNEIAPIKGEMRKLSRLDPETYLDALTRGDLDDESEDGKDGKGAKGMKGAKGEKESSGSTPSASAPPTSESPTPAQDVSSSPDPNQPYQD